MATTFRIVVQIDPSGARRGARVVKRELKSVGAAANRTRQLITRAFAFVSIGAVLLKSIGVLAAFSQEMSTIRAVTGATETQFKALRDEAKRLGETTRFSATEAAEGMTFLARTGFDTTQVLAAIGPVLNLAVAGALDLGRAADLASNTLKSFGLDISETGRVVDVFALTANSANTTVEQLGQAMSFVAPAAKSVGVEIELAAAAIGTLSDAGVQATRAGTGLRQIFIQLEKAGGELSIQNNGLVKVLETLRDRNLDLVGATELVGARQATSLLILKDNIEGLKGLNLALGNAAGTAKRVADTMDDNLNGALKRVRSALEGFTLAIGDAGATGALRDFFEGLASGLRFLITNIDTFLNVLNTLILVIGTRLALQAIPAAIVAFKALGVAILANPIGLVATAVVIAIAAFVSFRDEIAEAGGAFGDLGDTINALGDLISAFGTTAFAAITSIIPALKDFGGNWEFIAKTTKNSIFIIVDALDFLLATSTGISAAIIATFKNLIPAFKQIGVLAINGMIAAFETGVNAIVTLVNNIPGVDLDTFKAGRVDKPKFSELPADAFKRNFDRERGSISRALAVKTEENAVVRLNEVLGNAVQSTEAFERAGMKSIATLTAGTEATKSLGSASSGTSKATDELKSSLDSLVASVSPLASAQTQLAEATTILNQSVMAGLITQERSVELLRRVRREIVGVGNAQTDFTESSKLLNDALADGVITTGEYGVAMRNLEETVNSGALSIGTVLDNAFTSAGDALAKFVETGKFDFKSLISSMIKDLANLAAQSLTGGGSGGGLGSLFGGLFGGGSKGGSGGGLFSGISSLFGFANGGGFTVGGNFGTDRNILSINNQPVARVSRGESVNVSPNGSGRPITVVMNISTPDAESFQRSQGQILARTQAGLARANARNN